jgi:hypothetical protein
MKADWRAKALLKQSRALDVNEELPKGIRHSFGLFRRDEVRLILICAPRLRSGRTGFGF